jgi:hypothetical protein
MIIIIYIQDLNNNADMKTFFLPIIALAFMINLFSCSKKIVPGRYVYDGNKSYFEINKDNSYYFSTIGDVHGVLMFSKGESIFKNGEVNFIPDSSFFFHINVSKYYFDPALGNNRKIVLDVPDSLLSKFDFSFNASESSIINFSNSHSVIYKPILPSYQDGSLTLKAKLNDSIVILPRLLHDHIMSNSIEFFDVNNDDPNNKQWNVLELKVKINRDMFAFSVLPTYILKNKELIEKSCPIYKLTKQ